MEFYVILLLVAAASAGSDRYYHYAPQTQLVQTQQVPTVYQTVHTQAHQLPTIYKVHHDGEDDDDSDEETDVYAVHQVNPVQYSQFSTQVQPIQYAQVQPINYNQISHIRTRRSADHHKYYLTNEQGTHLYHHDDEDVDDDNDDGSDEVDTHFRRVRSAESTESVETTATANSHFLNLLTNKPQATQVNPLVQYVRTSGNVFTQTPANNVGTTLIKNAQPAVQFPPVQFDTVEVVAPQVAHTPVFRTVAAPVIHAPVFNTLQAQDIVKSVQTPVHLQAVQYQAFQTPVHFQAVQAPVQVQTVHTPTVYNQVVAPVQLVNQPIFKAVHTPIVQTVAQELTPGYVAANHGAVHTAPLPEGPSNDGFFASHHINLPNVHA